MFNFASIFKFLTPDPTDFIQQYFPSSAPTVGNQVVKREGYGESGSGSGWGSSGMSPGWNGGWKPPGWGGDSLNPT